MRKILNEKELVLAPGFVIGIFPKDEYDAVVRVITKNKGKISAFARGIRRAKHKGHLDILDYGDFYFKERNNSMPLLDPNYIVRSFTVLRTRLDVFICSEFITEFVDYCSDESNVADCYLYDFLENFMGQIKSTTSTRECLKVVYEHTRKLLLMQGVLDTTDSSINIPSKNNLNLLIATFQEYTQKKIRSYQELLHLINSIGNA
jgi:DNA repair protein RecO